MKRARDDAQSRDAFYEVPRTSLKDISAPECAEKRTRWRTSVETSECVCCLFIHASIKAHSLQVDSLHLNMSLWLVDPRPQVTNQDPLNAPSTRPPTCRTTHRVHTLLQYSPYLPMPLLSMRSSFQLYHPRISVLVHQRVDTSHFRPYSYIMVLFIPTIFKLCLHYTPLSRSHPSTRHAIFGHFLRNRFIYSDFFPSRARIITPLSPSTCELVMQKA